jgi:DNA gyrase subunit B
MYVGGTDSRSLHHLIWEIVDNSVDEALAGHCTEITVELKDDNTVKVTDNGRGIPVGINKESGESALMMVFEELHAGGKFGKGDGYKVSGGLHGVGASVTNALSSKLEVEVVRDGYLYSASWKQGIRDQNLKKIGATKRPTGTTVTWLYDSTIFESSVQYSTHLIAQRLKEKSYLVRNLRFVFTYQGKTQEFYSTKGIAELVESLAQEHEPLHEEVLYFENPEVQVTKEESITSIGVEVALQWTKKARYELHSFANVVTTPDEGKHVTGLKSAVTKALNNYAYETGKLKRDKKEPDRFEAKDIFSALTGAISVKLENPHFQGQTKNRLNNAEAQTAVQSFVYQDFTEWLANKKNHKVAREILERCLHSRKIRLAEQKVSKNYNPNSIWADSSQSSKLADCEGSSKVAFVHRELFVVEGDSAGGTAKAARDAQFQAILPLRGKPLNVLTSKNTKIFDNNEIQAIVMALGGRIEQIEGENVVSLPAEARRFGRIVVTADADTDGAHIAYLVLAIFYELFPDILKEGRVFLAKPPLYKITLDAKGAKWVYAYTDQERELIVKKHKRSGDDISRFKGLGEMNAEQLAETVMVPETRAILQVTIEDAQEVANTMNLIMGSSPERRKRWLEEGGAAKYEVTA